MHAVKEELQVPELRSAERITLVMRTAKLISQAGEYFCIVRDVSGSGTKLCFFHEPPNEEFVLLELANGAHYAMQQLWAKDFDSGYRFASPIDISEFIEERADYPRRPIRLRLDIPLLLIADGEDHNCRMINISQQGICVEAPVSLPVRMQCRIETDGLPILFAHTCWRKRKLHGLALQKGFRFDQLAKLVHAMRPATVKCANPVISDPIGEPVRHTARFG